MNVQGDPDRCADGDKEMVQCVELKSELRMSDVQYDPEECAKRDEEIL